MEKVIVIFVIINCILFSWPYFYFLLILIIVRYWLYGEILERDNKCILNPFERRELRGWFPRVCCSLANEVDDRKDD